MAYMIPDKMPAGSSKGEKLVFDLLQNLPEQCVAYYEPIVAQRYPDFIVIFPHLGVLIIEVKGWRLEEIETADPNGDGKSVTVKGVKSKHPTEQARQYMFKLMDCCKKNGACQQLKKNKELNLLKQQSPLT